jgi:hypothetical protein
MKYFLSVVAFLYVVNLEAQGLNNDNPIDQQDLKFLFEQNKLQPFKFCFTSTSDSSINIIIEEYRMGKLSKTKNVFEQFKPILAMGDDPLSDYFPPLNDTMKHWIRFYIDEKRKDTANLWFKTEMLQTKFPFKTIGINLTQARSFDTIPRILRRREPLFVYYGNKKPTMISCPGDAPVKDIVKMYDLVIAVYAEPLRLK